MEPVGLAASIITLVGVTSLTGSALSKIRGLRGTPPYILNTINAVSDFEATLRFLQLCLDELGDTASDEFKIEVGRHIERAQKLMEGFEKFLEKEVLRQRQGTLGNQNLKVKRRAKWKEFIGDGRSRFDALQLELDQIKKSLTLAFSAYNPRPVSKHFASIQQIDLIRPDGASILPLESGTNVDTSTLLENIILSSKTSNQLDDNNAETLPLSDPSTAAVKLNSSESSNAVQQSRTYVKIETKLVSRTCQRRCPCQCHIRLQGGTPRWLQGLIGTAFYNFAGTPLLNHRSCNFKKCGKQDHGSGTARFQYIFPAWLFPLGIEFTASWKVLGGIGGTWALRIPRAIFSYSAYRRLGWIAMNNGSVQDFQSTMDTNMIRATDIFPEKNLDSLFLLVLECARLDLCSLLLNSGVDLSFRGSSGYTNGEMIWEYYIHNKCLFTLSECPGLQEAYDNLNLSSAHELVIENQIEGLTRHIELYPASVLLRDCYGFTPLHWAARFSNLEIVDVLLNAGADVNSVCKNGMSVLARAVQSFSVACCQRLVDAGANVNILDNEMENILTWALSFNSISEELVSLILSTGIDVNHQNKYGQTAFMKSTIIQSQQIRDILLQHGADIEARDESDRTAIFYAVQSNKHATIKFLCDRKASLNIETQHGNSLLHYAAVFGDIETMHILEEARIEGLPMDEQSIKKYRQFFILRGEIYLDERAPIEEEEAAFIALLESVIPSDPESERDNSRYIPGAFPVEEADDEEEEEEEEEDYEEGESELGSDEYESDDSGGEEEKEVESSDGTESDDEDESTKQIQQGD